MSKITQLFIVGYMGSLASSIKHPDSTLLNWVQVIIGVLCVISILTDRD